MQRIFECVTSEHDPRILILMVLLCYFAASTALIMTQRAMAPGNTLRRVWLLAAGVVTGLGIWTTHFAAMAAFEPGDVIRTEFAYMLAALSWAIALSVVGWNLAFGQNPRHPLIGGALIGLALAGAHYFDTFGLRIAGHVRLDRDLVVVSLLVGIPCCMAAVRLLERKSTPGLPIVASGVLAAGIIGLHMIAMAGVTLIPDPTVELPAHGISLEAMGDLVILGGIGILAVGFAVGVHDQYTAAVTAEDRRRLAETLTALRQSQEHYRSTLELNPQIPWTTDASGYCLELGPKWTEYVGTPPEAGLGHGWLAVIHPADMPTVERMWKQAMEAGTPFDARYRIRCHDGTYRWFRDRGRPKSGDDGQILKWYGALEDIHEQACFEEALRESEERYRLACRATNDVIWDWRHGTDRIFWGSAIWSHFGHYGAAQGTTIGWWTEHVHPDDRGAVLESLNAAINGSDVRWSHEYRFRKADGLYAQIRSQGHIVRDRDGKAVRSLGAMIDITEQKRIEAELRHSAHHDPLTGLANRLLFNKRLSQAVDEAERSDGEVGLVLLDVNDFKRFNDSRGHGAGDKLLCELAHRLQHGHRVAATAARLGGDEFAIIIPQQQEGAPEIILESLQTPVEIDGEVVEVSVSAGVAVWPHDATCMQDLMKCADLALYACKSETRKSPCSFRPEMRSRVDARSIMLELADAALREDRIWAHYQPKVCLKTGTLIGMEALLRWEHPHEGLQSPAAIAAAFENPELAVKITDRILDCIIHDVRKWLDTGLHFGRIAFNASAADLARGNFAARVLSRLDQENISPQHLELEVIETVLMGRKPAHVSDMLGKLNRAGMTIALDDFGTGYASLSHLNQFPVNVLKIDQSFVRALSTAHRATDEAIIKAIIGLARNLGIQTIAEGIELPEEAQRLRELKCDVGQGYLFARPTAPANVPALLTQGMLQWPTVVRRPSPRSRAVGER